MARKKSTEPDTANPESDKSGGGTMRLVMVGVMSLSIAAAGYFIGGRGGAAVPAAAPPVTEPEVHEPEIAEVIDLEAVNVNLTDGHYLRVAISLGIGAHVEEDGGEGGHGKEKEEEAEEGPSIPIAPAADILLTTFAERSMAELSDVAGRADARHKLEAHLKEYYGEDVIVTVFVTEFVMQ